MFLFRGLIDDERHEGNGDDGVLLLLDGKGRGSAAGKPFVDDGVFGEPIESVGHILLPMFGISEYFHFYLCFNYLRESFFAC